MKYFAAFCLLLLAASSRLSAQDARDSLRQVRADSIRAADSVRRMQKTRDSIVLVRQLRIAHETDSVNKAIDTRRRRIYAAFQDAVRKNPWFNVARPPLRQSIEIREEKSNDDFFYFIVGLVLYVALVRLFFYKYVTTMFTVFFRASLRQQQLREQLLQAPLPALLMNVFFALSAATYCTLLAFQYGVNITDNFWTTYMYLVLIIAAIYLVKFIFLNMVGWIFGISNVTDTYIFIVFLINKMIGIFLLPFIALLFFPIPGMLKTAQMLSYILVAGMLFYRFIISYRPVRSEIKLNRLHFFIYLCAFEIAPLLLIYKVLLAFVGSS